MFLQNVTSSESISIHLKNQSIIRVSHIPLSSIACHYEPDLNYQHMDKKISNKLDILKNWHKTRDTQNVDIVNIVSSTNQR